MSIIKKLQLNKYENITYTQILAEKKNINIIERISRFVTQRWNTSTPQVQLFVEKKLKSVFCNYTNWNVMIILFLLTFSIGAISALFTFIAPRRRKNLTLYEKM